MTTERNRDWWVERVLMSLFIWIPSAILFLFGIIIVLVQIVIWLKTGEWMSLDLKDVIPLRCFVYDKDTWWIIRKVGLFLQNVPISVAAFVCGYILWVYIGDMAKGRQE